MAKSKWILWLVLVYGFSALCYLPGLLELWDVEVPPALSYLRNGFVLIPAIVSFSFLLYSHSLKAYFVGSFKVVSRKELLVCLGMVFLGVCCTAGYSLITGKELFVETYSSAFSFLTSSCYLLVTALMEEMAWRGFFLQRLAEGGRERRSLLIAGITWAFWHVPMWTAHELPWLQQVQLFAWAVLVALVLGMLYLRYRNIFSVALCHMLFNVCFLAPVAYNVSVLAIVLVCCLAFKRIYSKEEEL